MCLLDLCLYVFTKLPILVLCPFLNWIVYFFFNIMSYTSSSYILDVNPLSDMSSANVISPSVGCFFILLMVSFPVQKLFSLMWSHLKTFAFVSLA